MSTSGISTFNTTRAQIAYSALRKVNAIAEGDTPGNRQMTDTVYTLNALAKSLQASGIHVWTVAEGVLFPQSGQARYAIGPGTPDHVASTYTQTELAGAAANGAGSVTVADASSIASGNKIGIVVDDGTIHWTVVDGAPAGNVVTLDDTLPDSASEGAAVFVHPATTVVRPLKIVAARRHDIYTGRDVPISLIPRLDYVGLNAKTQTGTVNQFFYDAQLGTGYLHLFYAPFAVQEIIKFTWHRPIQDFASAGDNPDLPQEWIAALEWNLALELASGEHPVSDRVYSRIEKRAALHLGNVSGFDREEGSVYFQPDSESD